MLSPALATPHEFVLDNGLKVVFIPASAAPVATLLVVYRIGARNEAVGYTGSSHLLEHMLFKGTPKNHRGNGRAFADIMNEIGANKNATTWLDRTLYFETVPSGYLEYAIELEADRMRGAFIADADRRSEMTVVRNELERNDNNSMRVLNAALVATAFREHPYHHPTIGWRTDVEGVSTERLRELYDTYYHPDNATAFVVGDFDVARTRDAIERHFGALPRAALAIPDVYTEEPPQAGERSVVVKRPGDTTLVAYAYHTPAALGQLGVLSRAALAERAATLPDDNEGYALEVLSRILGRGRTSRFSRALVDTGLALDASAWDWGSRDPGLFQIVVNVRPGVATDAVRQGLDRALATMLESGPEASEVERVASQIAVQRAFARDGTYALAQRLAEFEAVGTWRLDEEYVERIAAVTPDAVRDVARKYLHEDNRTVGMLVPGVAKTFDVVPFEPIDVPRERPVAIEAAPLPAPRAMREARFAARVASGTLANGVAWRHVASLETPTVHVRGLCEAGPAVELANPMLPVIVAEMLSRGTRTHERRAIEERLERAGVRRSYAVDDDASGAYNPLAFRFSGACAAADLPLLLRTLADELREPAFEAAELELVRDEIVGSLRLARTATGWRSAQRFLELAYEPGSVHAAPDIDALLAAVAATRLEDVREFHERHLLANPPLVSCAGAVTAEELERRFGETLGNVPFVARPNATLPLVRARRRVATSRDDVVLERKANVDIVIGRATTLVRADSDFLAASIANGILGQSTLSSRLGLRLRDREGLTYGVTSAFLAPGKIGGPWRVGVSVNPANVERAIASVSAVLHEYAATGPREREFDAQRHSMAGQHHVALATNAGIAAQLERLAYHGLPDDDVDTYRERLEAVALGDVATAAARYLHDRELLVVAAGTFSG
ncbi:MAG: pitrilysin family protein [Vulcanimicrobiaceae bacterium]